MKNGKEMKKEKIISLISFLLLLGNTSFNIEAVKQMTFKEFESNYSKLLKGIEAGEAYFLLTGKKEKKRKRNKKRKDNIID